MIISQTAKTYAKGLVQILENGTISCDAILKDLRFVYEIIKSSHELKSVFESPAVTIEQKKMIIEDIFKNKISENVVNFLKLISEKNRFCEFEQIIEAFQLEVDEINNIKRIQVISAIELSEGQKNKIIQKLCEKLSKTVIANWQIDNNIIAGLIIKIDDNVIDDSIKNKLKCLSKIKGNL